MSKKQTPLSYIEISRNNLIHNIKQLKSLTKKGTKISAVIKANAYGHGQNEVAKILEPFVDYFAVHSITELVSLRQVSKKKTFVLGYVENSDLAMAIKLDCVLSVFSLEHLLKISAVAKKSKKIQEVNIACDALLGREGFLSGDFKELCRMLPKIKNIKILGMYAHFANIEDTANFIHAGKQIKEYEKMLEIAEELNLTDGGKLQTHISATSGLLAYEKGRGLHSLIRLGIGLYGMWPSEELKLVYKNSKIKLKPVMTWKTKIAQVKTLDKGMTIGYGLTFKTKQRTKIAVIPSGYADGFDRGLSNNGEVLIRGRRCPVLGRVAMNMIIADVSKLVVVKTEDEVVLLGRQGKEEITAEEMAGKIGTINYEITTRVSPLLPRIVA